MKFVDYLEKTTGPASTFTIRRADEFLPNVPSDPLVLDIISAELAQLNSDEVSRFDGWNNKGAAMLGASGLLLSLAPLGLPFFEAPSELQSVMGVVFWFLPLVPFAVAIGFFFLATWHSLVSLRARPLCRPDEDEWLQNDLPGQVEFKRNLVASLVTTYKNNTIIVNAKATKVNEALRCFFRGTAFQILFLIMAILKSTHGS